VKPLIGLVVPVPDCQVYGSCVSNVEFTTGRESKRKLLTSVECWRVDLCRAFQASISLGNSKHHCDLLPTVIANK
jgi:hypothetical protein